MKLVKAIAAAVGTAAAVGAAVYAKRRLDETQTPLKKQRSVTVWKSGGEVQHKEVIKNPVSDTEQTDILKSRIEKATRQYESLADRDNDKENEPEIAPVNFTFVQSEEESNTGVSFDRVFDHFNRLEKPFEEENNNADNDNSNSIVDTIPANPSNTAVDEEAVSQTEAVGETTEDVATDDGCEAAAIAAVMTMQEEQDSETEPKQMKLEKGIMTPEPIVSAVRELADIQSVSDGMNVESVESIPVDENIFDLSVSEPVEEAVKAFEEMSEQTEAEEQPEDVTETSESASTLEEEFAQAMAENAPVSEPVEEAVKALEEISEQTEAEEQSETAEEKAEAVSTLEEEFAQAMVENTPVSEPVEEAAKELEEISEQTEAEEQPETAEETAEAVSTLEEEFAQAMAENVSVSEPVEEAVKAFEEIAEPEATEIAESQTEDMSFENIDDLNDDMASVRTAESVEDAVKEFSDLIGEPEAAQSMLNDDNEYDDDLEQTGDILSEESGIAKEQPVIQTVPEEQAEKPRTVDFFDLPDEAYAPVQVAEEKHDDNVAEVEDLFGDLLVDDEPVEKKTFTDPSEVFSMFDTADAGQDDFDKYNDEKIEEETEKKKTSDTKKYIAQDIADNIASFAQLLEPLNAIKENKIRSKSGILFDWEMRIQSLIGDLPIKTYWRNNFRNYEIWTDEKCMEKAGELLSMLELVGIVRDKAKEVVIDKDTLDFYSAQSEHLNNDFHIGETVVVTRPCWRINGKPARKGEIAKKAPFAEFSRKKVSPLETMLRENSCSDGDVNIPVTEDNFCTYDREIPYVKQAIADGFCKCAVRRMEDGGALAFFYEVIAEGENEHYSPCTLRFEVNIDKNAKVVGRFRSEKV
ncbi:MAG: hypothetical protein J6L61_07675 [Ruminiclostridium sp.]|nr:hypothetical protein [Ruminiclostridium sp.]